MASDGFWRLLMAADGSRWHGSRWLPMAPNGSRWLPMAPDGSRWLPMASDGFSWFLMVSHDFSWRLLLASPPRVSSLLLASPRFSWDLIASATAAQARLDEESGARRAVEGIAARQAVHCSLLGDALALAERDGAARERQALFEAQQVSAPVLPHASCAPAPAPLLLVLQHPPLPPLPLLPVLPCAWSRAQAARLLVEQVSRAEEDLPKPSDDF